jgi:CubicO group peptidase (beta-lactamase class C family)
VTDDTLWRIYSMTKPITSVAAMILYEEGRLALTDPVSEFIPAFKDVRVYDGGSDQKQVTVPAAEPVRIWHLLTHTAGLTYGFHRVHPVDALYRAAGFEWGTPPGADLAQACDIWATIPLLFQPGAEWNYSVATDVLGRVVEVASGTAARRLLRGQDLPPPRHDPDGLLSGPRCRPPGSPPSTAPAGTGAPSGWTNSAGPRSGGRACSAEAAAWCPLRPTTTGSPGCCWPRTPARPASSTAPGC